MLGTLSADYRSLSDGSIGIGINNHPCMSLRGLEQSAAPDGTFNSWSFDWLVLPSDGLFKGNNTITLCGGADHDGGSITLGFNSLAARISK